ncbi:glycosyltransferase [Sphingomonas sp. KR1UV-12]|uniref:Glycosyltransferase n=1 Tax=Sphingomonas aurea TaxID=3063994 RepID=A0ABT9EPJ1_9SPHN|nr:glycosyltransferase [Sphingomonas sp. KR1UV-12]MDP1028790.1 glycosyltransferase [Sphingomonas sp. KR1UV-12]
MTTPFLVILPVRNGGAYVRQAIASIVGQSDPDFRLVVLENASEDDTVAIVRSFADPRIEVVPAPRPLSIDENWARAKDVVAQVAGDTLVTFLGHDDYLYPDFIARMRALAQSDPEATLLQCHFDLIDAAGTLIRPCRPIAEQESWRDLAAMIAWGLRDAFGTGYVFRAADYLAVGGIPPLPGILYADHLLFLRLTRRGHKRATPSVDCAYRLHDSSMSNTVSIARINQRLEAFAAFAAILDSEFAALTDDDRGRQAMLTLLSREMFVFDGPMVRTSFDARGRARLDAIAGRIKALGGSRDVRHWAYQASRSERLWGRTRRALAYARARMRR